LVAFFLHFVNLKNPLKKLSPHPATFPETNPFASFKTLIKEPCPMSRRDFDPYQGSVILIFYVLKTFFGTVQADEVPPMEE